MPLIPSTLVLASRVTLEAPRRTALDTNDRTEWALVADLVLTGKAQRFPVDYAFGVYNLFDWRYSLPVNPFPAPVMPQAGRTFLASALGSSLLSKRESAGGRDRRASLPFGRRAG